MDDDYRKCGRCGAERNVRSMSCMSGVWLCASCYDLGRLAAAMITKKTPPVETDGARTEGEG